MSIEQEQRERLVSFFQEYITLYDAMLEQSATTLKKLPVKGFAGKYLRELTVRERKAVQAHSFLQVLKRDERIETFTSTLDVIKKRAAGIMRSVSRDSISANPSSSPVDDEVERWQRWAEYDFCEDLTALVEQIEIVIYGWGKAGK